jgi:uncharacterized protein YraI
MGEKMLVGLLIHLKSSPVITPVGEIVSRPLRLFAPTALMVFGRFTQMPLLLRTAGLPALIVAAAAALVLAFARPAAAEPGTPVAYPAGAASAGYSGAAFDTCTAPSLSTMRAWSTSPYGAIGIYIGGYRSCSQPQLTASWVYELTKRGWRLLPIYVGRQAPCAYRYFKYVISRSTLATSQGRDAATDAVARAKVLGLRSGSGIYLDIEYYDPNDSSCRTAVRRYISGWTKQLHAKGYLAGVYINTAGLKHLVRTYMSTSYARPDAVWLARWDGSSALTGWSGIPNDKWSVHQRAKQYRGDHTESYGGVRLRIDTDRLDAPVGTVAYAYRVTANGLNARTGPGTSYPVVRVLPKGSAVRVVCRTTGTKIGTTSVWKKLTDGTYVSDYYVDPPPRTSYPVPPPRCVYPYQVTSKTGLYQRTGPGTSYRIAGVLSPGALAWVVCQRAGSKVGTTRIWNRLLNGRWVSDYYVATPSNTTYSKPIRRC